MKHLVIIGAGKFGRELYWHTTKSVGFNTEYDIKGYIDDYYQAGLEEYKNIPIPVLSTIDKYNVEEDDVFISAVGDVNGRAITVEKIRKKGGKFISIIHNTSLIQGNVSIGEGVFIGPYTAIGDSASIGNHVMINTLSSVGHDAVLGDYTCVMAHVDITGCCQIEKKVFLASGVRLAPGAKIGENAYVGIGSVVLKKVKANTKVFGNPATEI